MSILRAALLTLAASPAFADDPVVLVQSTTSTQNSGLYAHILPVASEALGLDIRVVAVGTGQALGNAQRCDGDMLITHARAAEEAFVAAGYGTARHDLMYNDFVIVGPSDDPAGVAGAALYLLSDLGKSCTGETHHVDAGFHIVGMPDLSDTD